MNPTPAPRRTAGLVAAVDEDVGPLGANRPRDIDQREVGHRDSRRRRLAGCSVGLVHRDSYLGDVGEVDVPVGYVCYSACFVGFGFDSDACRHACQ